jgi:hypothetical protein
MVATAAGCQVGPTARTPAGKGTLTFNVTDAPGKPEITGIILTITKILVHRATPETETASETSTSTSTTPAEGEWIEIPVPTAMNTFDLLKLQGVEQLLASTEMAAGKYTQIRLTVQKAEVGLDGAAPMGATLPSGVLKLVHPFDVVAGEVTTITLDFDAEKSVTVTGQGLPIVKPVVKLSVKPPKSQNTQPSLNAAQKIALDFIKGGPTYAFDGVEGTLTLTNTQTLQTPNTWQFTYEFDCSHAGYGDRSGQSPAEALTHHVAVITVENGSVTSAILDGAWNELTQEAVPGP